MIAIEFMFKFRRMCKVLWILCPFRTRQRKFQCIASVLELRHADSGRGIVFGGILSALISCQDIESQLCRRLYVFDIVFDFDEAADCEEYNYPRLCLVVSPDAWEDVRPARAISCYFGKWKKSTC